MIRTLSFAVSLYLLGGTALANPADGYYVTYDDKTEAPRGLVELRVEPSGEMRGYLRGSFAPDEDMSGVCNTCSDELLNQPLWGLPFIWGLEMDEPRKFKSGRIQDPESGDTYKAKIKFSEDFNTVDLRGYIGSPIFGRTQIWQRANADEIAAINANVTAFGLEPIVVTNAQP